MIPLVPLYVCQKYLPVIPRTLLDPSLTLDFLFFSMAKIRQSSGTALDRVFSYKSRITGGALWTHAELVGRCIFSPSLILADVKCKKTPNMLKQKRFHQRLPSFSGRIFRFSNFHGLRYRLLVHYSFTDWSKRGSAHCAALRPTPVFHGSIMKLLHHPCRFCAFVSDTQGCCFLNCILSCVFCYWHAIDFSSSFDIHQYSEAFCKAIGPIPLWLILNDALPSRFNNIGVAELCPLGGASRCEIWW